MFKDSKLSKLNNKILKFTKKHATRVNYSMTYRLKCFAEKVSCFVVQLKVHHEVTRTYKIALCLCVLMSGDKPTESEVPSLHLQ